MAVEEKSMFSKVKERLLSSGDIATDNPYLLAALDYLRGDQGRKVIATAEVNPLENIVDAIRRAIRLGLYLGDYTAEAYLEVKKGVAQLSIGYKGYRKKALQSGQVIDIRAEVVYGRGEKDGDTFEVERTGDRSTLLHREGTGLRTPARMTDVYCIAHYPPTTGLPPLISRMSKEQVKEIAGRSRSGSSGPWATDPVAMWKKSVIRKVCAQDLSLGHDFTEAAVREIVRDGTDTIPDNVPIF